MNPVVDIAEMTTEGYDLGLPDLETLIVAASEENQKIKDNNLEIQRMLDNATLELDYMKELQNTTNKLNKGGLIMYFPPI